MSTGLTEIDLPTFEGCIPPRTDLVIFEKGDPDTALVLYGFDEVDLFTQQFKNPAYGFMAQ